MQLRSLLTGRALLLGLAFFLVPGVARPQAAGDAHVDLDSLTSVESRRRALEELTAAADRRRREGEVPGLVRALNLLGELHLKLNAPDPARGLADEALALARKSGDTELLADTLIHCGVVHRSLEDYKTALEHFDEALRLSRQPGYRHGQAKSLSETGATYYYLSELGKAVDYGERALRLWRELGDRRGEAQALYYLGAPYMRLGRAREAADTLEAAAAVWREVGRPTDQARALVGLNFLAIRAGQWNKALTLLNKVHPLIIDREAEPFLSGQIATSFGEVYEAYGQLETARRYFDEALLLYRDHAREFGAAVDAGRKSGRVQARLGDYEGAVRQIEEGLRLAEKYDNRFMAALCREDLGRVHLVAGLYEPATRQLLRAISGYERAGGRREWARAQTFLGEAFYKQGRTDAAAKAYGEALRVFREIEDYTNEAAVHFGLGKLELGRQNLDRAGQHLKRSIDITERLRENAASKDLRSSFLASFHDRYEAYVDWLMRLHAERPGDGFDIAAFEASESGRARSLLDSIRDYQRELRRAADPALLLDEEALQKEEQRLLDRRAKLQSEGGGRAGVEEVETELARVRARYEAVEAQINSDAKFNDLLRPAPLSFQEIKNQVADTETALLEFSLGEAKSYLWVVTPDGLTSYELAGKKIIERAALELAGLLAERDPTAAREDEVGRAAAELSRLILGPAAAQLRAHRLIMVADGVLQYVPFQVLDDPANPGEPLVVRHEVVNVPSASTLLLVRRERSSRLLAPKLLAAFGDPVFSSSYGLDSAVARGAAGSGPQRAPESAAEDTLDPAKLPPLFYSKQELNVLRKLAPGDSALIYSGFDATRDRLLGLDLSRYRVLHFATHGLLNAKQPELSGLVLSLVDRDGRPANGFVGLADVYNLRAPVDLVVLSACRTALGREMRGEGMVGLTRGFMYAGASSVVSSLWKVDDEATSELMRRFYANMLQGGMPPATALREAQNSIRREPQWRSPYYWAAFTLHGEYRQIIQPSHRRPLLGRAAVAVTAVLVVLLVGAAWWVLRRAGKLSTRGAAPSPR